MVNMSSCIVDGDKLPLSLAVALSAAEPTRHFCSHRSPHNALYNIHNDFCQLSFSLRPLELRIDFIMSCDPQEASLTNLLYDKWEFLFCIVEAAKSGKADKCLLCALYAECWMLPICRFCYKTFEEWCSEGIAVCFIFNKKHSRKPF